MYKFLILYIFYILVLIFTNISCSSTNQKYSDSMPVTPEIFLKISNNQADFIFLLQANDKNNSEKIQFINSIKNLRVYIIKNNNIQDSVLFEISNMSAVPHGETVSVNLTAKANLKDIKTEDFSQNKFEFQFESLNINYKIIKNYSEIFVKNEQELALELKPIIEIKSPNNIIFSLEAVRRKIIENEYFSNSETFRVEILDKKQRILWSSSYRLNFLQVIKKVEPVLLNSNYKYEVNWNGKTNSGSELESGEYEVKMTLPARPNNYIISTKFKWK